MSSVRVVACYCGCLMRFFAALLRKLVVSKDSTGPICGIAL